MAKKRWGAYGTNLVPHATPWESEDDLTLWFMTDKQCIRCRENESIGKGLTPWFGWYPIDLYCQACWGNRMEWRK